MLPSSQFNQGTERSILNNHWRSISYVFRSILSQIPSVPSSTSALSRTIPTHILTEYSLDCVGMTFPKCHTLHTWHLLINANLIINSTLQLPKTLHTTQYHLQPYYTNHITLILQFIQSTLLKQAEMSGLRLLTTRVAGRAPSARLFTTTAPFKKTATETAKETIQTANKKAGEAGVAAIEKGRTSFPLPPQSHFPIPIPNAPSIPSHPITL